MTFNPVLAERKKQKLIIVSVQITLFVLFIAAWEILAELGVINAFLFSKPSNIIKIFYKYVVSFEIFIHVGVSLLETLLGLVIGTILGLIIAVILWWSETLAKIVDPFLVVLNALPKTALAPLMIIWVGIGIKGTTVVAISILLVVTIITCYNAFNQIEEEKIRMLKSFGANRFQILTYLVLPSNYPNLVGVVKINIGMAWVGVIVGEFIISRYGIGHLINYGFQKYNMDLIMMGVMVLAFLTFIMYALISLLEKKFKNKRGIK